MSYLLDEIRDPAALVARFVGRGVGWRPKEDGRRGLRSLDPNAGYQRRWRQRNLDEARRRTREWMRRLRARRRAERGRGNLQAA